MHYTFTFPLQRRFLFENIQSTFKGGLFALDFIFCFRFKELHHTSLVRVYQSCMLVYIFLSEASAHLFEDRTDKLRPSVGRQQPPLFRALCD